jgi:hypothetical protein
MVAIVCALDEGTVFDPACLQIDDLLKLIFVYIGIHGATYTASGNSLNPLRNFGLEKFCRPVLGKSQEARRR